MYLWIFARDLRSDPGTGKGDRKGYRLPESLGVIIESPGFLTNMTGFRNLEILADMNRRITAAQIRLVLKKVGLEP